MTETRLAACACAIVGQDVEQRRERSTSSAILPKNCSAGCGLRYGPKARHTRSRLVWSGALGQKARIRSEHPAFDLHYPHVRRGRVPVGTVSPKALRSPR